MTNTIGNPNQTPDLLKNFLKNIKDHLRTNKQFTLFDKVKLLPSCRDLSQLDFMYLQNFRIFLQCIFNKATKKLKMTTQICYPDINVKLLRIKQPYKIVSSPLTKLLIKKRKLSPNSQKQQIRRAKNTNHFKFGFITFDQNHRFLLFLASDILTKQVPLIGLWVQGDFLTNSSNNFYSSEILHCLICNFLTHTKMVNKLTFSKSKIAFFVVIFSLNGKKPKFFEATLMKN